MKQINTNQEIVLYPSSSFFKKDWCEKDSNGNSKKLSQKEQLIQLCWNGMLPVLLPEISEINPGELPIMLWDINETANLLHLRLGEFNKFMNDECSINPYVVMELAEMN